MYPPCNNELHSVPKAILAAAAVVRTLADACWNPLLAGVPGGEGASRPLPPNPPQAKPNQAKPRHEPNSKESWDPTVMHAGDCYAGPSLVPSPAQAMQAIFRTAPSLLRKLSTKRVRFACSSQAKPKPAELSHTHQNQTIFTTAPFALALYALYIPRQRAMCAIRIRHCFVRTLQ